MIKGYRDFHIIGLDAGPSIEDSIGILKPDATCRYDESNQAILHFLLTAMT